MRKMFLLVFYGSILLLANGIYCYNYYKKERDNNKDKVNESLKKMKECDKSHPFKSNIKDTNRSKNRPLIDKEKKFA